MTKEDRELACLYSGRTLFILGMHFWIVLTVLSKDDFLHMTVAFILVIYCAVISWITQIKITKLEGKLSE